MTSTGTVRCSGRDGTAAIEMDDGDWCSVEFRGGDVRAGDRISGLIRQAHGSQTIYNLTQGSRETVSAQAWGSAQAIRDMMPSDAKIDMARFVH